MPKGQVFIKTQEDSLLKCQDKGIDESLPTVLTQKVTKKYIAWTKRQTYLYMKYLKRFSKWFKMIKELRLFVRMARFIPSRTSHKVKSHHQKMIVKYRTISNIVQYIEQSLRSQSQKSSQFSYEMKEIDEKYDWLFDFEQKCLKSLAEYFTDKTGIKLTKEVLMAKYEPPFAKIQDSEEPYKYFVKIQPQQEGHLLHHHNI